MVIGAATRIKSAVVSPRDWTAPLGAHKWTTLVITAPENRLPTERFGGLGEGKGSGRRGVKGAD